MIRVALLFAALLVACGDNADPDAFPLCSDICPDGPVNATYTPGYTHSICQIAPEYASCCNPDDTHYDGTCQ